MPPHYLIIGGSFGVGLHVAQKLLNKSNQVSSLCRNTPPFEHPKLYHHFFDVADSIGNFPLIEEPLAGLVYFPGTINLKSFKSLSKDDFLSDWEINFLGATQAVQAYLPQLEVGVGCFDRFHEYCCYSNRDAFSRFKRCEGLTLSLAAELTPKIRVNAIAPSLTVTHLAQQLIQDPKKKELFEKRHPLKRLGTTDDLSEKVLFLLTERSSWMTGQILNTDGGLSNHVNF